MLQQLAVNLWHKIILDFPLLYVRNLFWSFPKTFPLNLVPSRLDPVPRNTAVACENSRTTLDEYVYVGVLVLLLFVPLLC